VAQLDGASRLPAILSNGAWYHRLMPARSGLSELVLLVVALGIAPAFLVSCSSPERHDAPPETKPPSCEASNTCSSGTGSLPPITDPTVIATPCGHSGSTCSGPEGGVYEGGAAPVQDAQSEGVATPDAGVVIDASRPTDGGPG
jgi:hypothetical protein